MKPVILISSCRRDQERGYHDVIRATWGQSSAIPYYFLLGEGAGSQWADEVVIFGVKDDYQSLPYKTREGHRWALQCGHDYIFQAFVDTYIATDRLLHCGFDNWDYYGHFPKENLETHQYAPILTTRDGGPSYASGGPGYMLSKPSSQLLCLEEPDHWAEDLWVGTVMAKHGIRGVHDQRFRFKGGCGPEMITSHLSRGPGEYDPAWMRETHDCYLKLLEGAEHNG